MSKHTALRLEVIQRDIQLQSGVVRGEEFNSIMEQSPRLAQAMADGLGVSRGELRAMAADGKLTSETVINAVRSQGAAISSEFETLPQTVGNAVQTMKNTMFLFIGDINEVVNQSGKMAEGIDYISEAIKNIDPSTMAALNLKFEMTVETVGVLFTTIKDLYTGFSDLIGIMDLTSKSGEKIGLITRFIQNANVAMGVMIDGVKGFSIIADSVFGTISGIIGSVLIGIAKINGETSTMGEELMRKQEELHKRSEQKMAEFQSTTGKAWAEMNKTAQDRLEDTLAKTTEVYDEMVAKGGHSAEAMEEQYIKVALAKIAANNMIVSDDDRLALAAKDLQVTISETGEVAIESSKGVQAAYLGVGQSFAEVALEAEKSGTSMRESLADAVPKAQTIGAVDDIISSLSALSSQGKISGEDLAYGINLANERYKEIEENFARYAAQSIKDNDGIVTSELEKAAALQGLAVQATETGGVLVTQLDRSTLASERTKEQIDELAGAFGVGLSKEFLKSSEELDMLVDGFDDLENAGYDAGGALVGALTEMSEKAKNEVEIEALTARWHELYKEGKITASELAGGLEQVENRANMLKEGINSVTEAYGFLGLKTREELAKDAKAYTDSYNMVMEKGELTAQQQEQVFTKMAKANIAANGGVIDSFTAAQAAAKGFTVEVDKNGRVIVEKMDGAAKAVSAVKPPVDGAAKAMRGLGDEADDAGKRMVKAASKAYKEFDKLKKSLDDQGRVLNTKGEVMKVATYTQESAFESLLQRLGLSESSLTNSERNKLRSQASRMAKADGHLRDPYKYGLTNAMQADQMADEFVESWERRMEKEEWHKDIDSRRDDTSSGEKSESGGVETSDYERQKKMAEYNEHLYEMSVKAYQKQWESIKDASKDLSAADKAMLDRDEIPRSMQSMYDTLNRLSNEMDNNGIKIGKAMQDTANDKKGGYLFDYLGTPDQVKKMLAAQPQPVLPQSALDAIANLSKAPNFGASKGGGPVKTIKLDLSFNGKEVSTEMPENQEGALMALLQQLQESKALSGH
ncbi:tape measure protein [Psychrobacter celer]